MPDIIKRKALEEQERNRQTDKASALLEAVKARGMRPVRKIEWADPTKHPNREVEIVPLPNYTGGKAEFTLKPDGPNEPIRIQRLPYPIDTKMRGEEQTGGMLIKPSGIFRDEAAPKAPTVPQTIQQPMGGIGGPKSADTGWKTGTMRSAVSPFGKGLAQMMALSDENPEAAKRLYQTMKTSERDPDSPYYRPYALPTNQWMMEELSRLGIDISNGNTGDGRLCQNLEKLECL